MASWLVRSSPERGVRVRALARDTVLCSWARHLTLTVLLSTQEYKWVPANCWGNLTNCGGMTCDGLASRPGGVEILLAVSFYRNHSSGAMSQFGSKTAFFFFISWSHLFWISCDILMVPRSTRRHFSALFSLNSNMQCACHFLVCEVSILPSEVVGNNRDV